MTDSYTQRRIRPSVKNPKPLFGTIAMAVQDSLPCTSS